MSLSAGYAVTSEKNRLTSSQLDITRDPRFISHAALSDHRSAFLRRHFSLLCPAGHDIRYMRLVQHPRPSGQSCGSGMLQRDQRVRLFRGKLGSAPSWDAVVLLRCHVRAYSAQGTVCIAAVQADTILQTPIVPRFLPQLYQRHDIVTTETFDTHTFLQDCCDCDGHMCPPWLCHCGHQCSDDYQVAIAPSILRQRARDPCHRVGWYPISSPTLHDVVTSSTSVA